MLLLDNTTETTIVRIFMCLFVLWLGSQVDKHETDEHSIFLP